MSLKSMTGFSATTLTLTVTNAQKIKSRVGVTMTLKSLNSRFFEANCKLPYALTHLETELIKRFKTSLYRGNIYFTLHMSNPQALTASIEPATAAIANYIKAVHDIQSQFKLEGLFTVNDLLKLPHVFEVPEQPLDKAVEETILLAVNDLIKQLQTTREQEGLALAHDLHDRIHAIRQYLHELEPRATYVLDQRKEQLMQTVKQALVDNPTPGLGETPQWVVYNQLDKIAIHEELVRFKTHLETLFGVLESNDKEKGKKLDFTLQELFREINTMSAKCNDAAISSLAINIKLELEKAREQAQNIV